MDALLNLQQKKTRIDNKEILAGQLAGKGHEEGQKIGRVVIPFSDHEAVKAAVAGVDYHG